MDIYYNLDKGWRTTASGAKVSTALVLAYPEEPVWIFHFRNDAGEPVDLTMCPVWRAAIDSDRDDTTMPLSRTLDSGIDKSRLTEGIVGVQVTTFTQGFHDAVNGKESGTKLLFELWGLSSAGRGLIRITIDVTGLMSVDPQGGTPPEQPETDEYATKMYVDAAVSRELIYEYSEDGSQFRVRHGENGVPSEWQDVLTGEAGKSAYELAVEQGFEGTETEWLAGLKGATGEAGKSAYELAVELGYQGSVSSWLNSLKGDPGERGKDGQGLAFDATGTSTERSLYDECQKGFRYATSVIDSTAKTTTLYIWIKQSDLYGDWSDPLTVVLYGMDPAASAVNTPVEFDPPSGTAEYLQVKSPAEYATVSAVTVETADGELTLPYWSEFGVKKILRKNGSFYFYFGTAVPEYTKGKIYFAQLITSDKSDVSDPSDESDSVIYYGYVQDSSLQSVAGVTEAMLTAGTMKSVKADSLGKTSLGSVPAGAFAVVACPAGMTATKDDGFGGKVPFTEDNAQIGTGANGASLTVGGKDYRIYGELKLNRAEVFVYVD